MVVNRKIEWYYLGITYIQGLAVDFLNNETSQNTVVDIMKGFK